MEDLKPYPKYKAIEAPWLSTIPDHWKYDKVKHCFDERSEKGYPNEPLLSATQSRGVIPQSLYENRVVSATKDFHQLKLVKVGDFVISLRSFQGGIEYAHYRGIISPAYTIMVANSQVERSYFKHLAKSEDFIKLLQTCVTGIREGQNVDYKLLKKNFLPLPPLSEQIQIANYLDYKVALINKFIKDKKKEIILLKEQKQAEINQAVTRGVNPNAKMKDSGISWIGEIPEHWDKRYLFQLCEEQKQSNKSIKNQNLLSLSYGRIINKDINSTAGLLPASFDTYQIVNNGNIILRLTDLQNDHKSLRVGLATQTGIITSAYTCLKVKDTINPEYLYLALHTYDILKVFYGMGGGLRQSIGFKEIRKLIFNLPSLDEQQEIITHIKSIDDRIEIAVSAIDNQIKLMQEYKTSLISDVVTGKVDVRNIAVQNTEDETEEDVEEMEDTEEIENSEE